MDIRDRIKRRLGVCGYSMKQIEEELGLSRTFISDFLGGRKNTLSDDVIRELAAKLRTTEIWLLRGAGPEEPNGSETSPSVQVVNSITWSDIHAAQIEKVMPKEKKSVVFTGFDFTTGAAGVQEEGSRSPRVSALVVDPEIFVPGNAYALAFAQRQPIRVIVKRVLLKGGQEIWFILDLST